MIRQTNAVIFIIISQCLMIGSLTTENWDFTLITCALFLLMRAISALKGDVKVPSFIGVILWTAFVILGLSSVAEILMNLLL